MIIKNNLFPVIINDIRNDFFNKKVSQKSMNHYASYLAKDFIDKLDNQSNIPVNNLFNSLFILLNVIFDIKINKLRGLDNLDNLSDYEIDLFNNNRNLFFTNYVKKLLSIYENYFVENYHNENHPYYKDFCNLNTEDNNVKIFVENSAIKNIALIVILTYVYSEYYFTADNKVLDTAGAFNNLVINNIPVTFEENFIASQFIKFIETYSNINIFKEKP